MAISTQSQSEVVDGQILSFFPELVKELNGSLKDLLDVVGLDLTAFQIGQLKPTYREMVELVDLAATQLCCPDFGMRMAKCQAGHIGSPLVALMQSCQSAPNAGPGSASNRGPRFDARGGLSR